MNSNSFLLSFSSGDPVPVADAAAVLERFVHGPLLPELLLEGDRVRNWNNYSSVDYADATEAVVVHVAGTVVRHRRPLQLTALRSDQLTARLAWMLTAAPSPYRRHLNLTAARNLADGFLDSLASAHGGGPDFWAFSVCPDFLHRTGYYGGRTGDFAYFDGGDADTATFFQLAGICHLLLTNGSP